MTHGELHDQGVHVGRGRTSDRGQLMPRVQGMSEGSFREQSAGTMQMGESEQLSNLSSCDRGQQYVLPSSD